MQITSPAPVPAAVAASAPFVPRDATVTSLQPAAYRLNLRLDPAARSLGGTSEIELVNRTAEPQRDLRLMLGSGTQLPGRVDVPLGLRGEIRDIRVDGRTVPFEQRGVLTTALLPGAIAPGASARVTVSFETRTPRVPFRLGRDSAGTLSYMHAFPLVALRDDRGWNTDPYLMFGENVYATPATWDVTVDAPAGTQVVMSGEAAAPPAALAQAVAGGRALHRSVASTAREFAVVAGPNLQRMGTRTAGGVEITAWAAPAQAADAARALEAAAVTADDLAGRFGPALRPTFDVVVRPHGEGMEMPGLVTVGSSVDEPVARGSRLAETAVHEIAHQWWYDGVGNNEYDDAWLDEGFTNFTTDRVVADHPELRITARKPRRPLPEIDVPIDAPANAFRVGSDYGASVYKRASNALEALREHLGAATFDRALAAWYVDHRGTNVTTDQFIEHMGAAAGSDLRPWFREHGIHGGLHPASAVQLDPRRPSDLTWAMAREFLKHLGDRRG